MRATLRWAHADLRAHRGEALFLVLASAGIIASLLLAGALFSYATNPWQRVFNQSQGAHIWLNTRADTNTGALAVPDEVAAVSGPFATAPATVEAHGTRGRVTLRAGGARPPKVARPLITEGRWLAGADRDTDADSDDENAGHRSDEVVLEASFARAVWARPGDTVRFTGARGEAVDLRVVGLAEVAEPRYRPGLAPGVAWAPQAALDRFGPTDKGQSIGLRLKDPADTDFVVQRAVTLLGSDNVAQVTTWQEARADAGGDDQLLGRMFAAFGVSGLIAAAVTASGAVTARVRGQLRDIAVLKAIGFTPGQVIRGCLVQHLAFAVLGTALGTAAIVFLGGWIPGRIGDAARLWKDMPGHTALTIGLPAATVLLIAGATALTAWRAGRVPPVPAARAALPTGAPMTALGRRALGLRLSPALVLGWRAAFTRPGRALVPVVRLALPLVLIAVGLVAWSTLDQFRTDPARVGVPAALTVRSGQSALTEADLERAIAEVPQIATVHPGVELAALAPGQTGTIVLRGLGLGGVPYPHTVVEGRAPRGGDEAVAGQGLLDFLGVGVGDWVRLTVQGRPQILHIVGRSIEPDFDGRVISTSLDVLRERDPRLRQEFLALVLRPGADPAQARTALDRATGGTVDIRETADPTTRLDPARGVIAALIAVSTLIGLIELLALIGADVRARSRDLLALKAIGLTPRQVGAVIVTAAGLTALVSAVLGTSVGTLAGGWLVDAQGRADGIGAGIAHRPPTLVLLTLVAGAVLGAVAAALVPAARAARRRPADSFTETM
ncbi:ABC transporter permease [Streptomyces sp. NBC_01006]|uniref:ABC transporter permease n=1 Tax=Streptomyces sp. NBC_01006 TaxID=2903716 RepID=UPI003870EB56|nr:ABC transporter permease [Streptomyces sp. NBC_01006]